MKTQEQFDASEHRWRAQLTGRSLVVEASADPVEAEKALHILGANYRRATSRESKTRFLLKYRASFLIGVCAVAYKYDLGGMWPYLEKVFGPLPQADQQIVSDAFRRSLDAFGLSRFTFPRRNVDEILLHAGIPGQRMDEFLELLARRDSLAEGLDGRQFCQWIAGMSQATAFAAHALDAPTYRFLAKGREIAEDLVDRALDLLDRWVVDPDRVDVSAFPGVMQPDLLRGLAELGEKPIARRSSRRTHQVDMKPKLVFDPGVGIVVRLPPIEYVTESRVDWTIATEGSMSRRSIDPPWPGDPVTPSHFPIVRPVKQAALTASPGDQSWLLEIIDPEDPLLIFDATNGEWVPPLNTIPKGELWIAVPNPKSRDIGEVLEIDGSFGTYSEVDGPLGWGGWTFVRVSTDEVNKLRLTDGEAWRYVSSIRRPSVEPSAPIDFTTGPDGAPVYSALPSVTIPGVARSEDTASAIRWHVSVTRADTGESLFDTEIESRDVTHTVPLMSASQVIGTVEVAVRGPLGRGTRRRLNIAEGWTARATNRFRPMLTDGSGLAPTDVELTDTRTTLETVLIKLDRRDESQVTALPAPTGIGLSVTVSVPSMSVTLLADRETLTTSRAPLQIDLDSLGRTQLAVTFGCPGKRELAVMSGGNLLQTVVANASGPLGVASFPLNQVTDTLTRHTSASLLVGLDGARIPVARVRPRVLIDDIQLANNQHLELIGLSTDQPLELAIYRRFAPWLGPHVVTTQGESTIDLPAELVGERHCRVSVRIHDPWVPHRWDHAYPRRAENIIDVKLGELTDDRGGVDQGFRAWLYGTARCNVTPESLPLAIGLYSHADLWMFSSPADKLRAQLAEAISTIRGHVPSRYRGLTATHPPVDLLVAADVVTLPPAPISVEPELWEAAPILAILASAGASHEHKDEFERVLGGDALVLLETGHDPRAATGAFTKTAEIVSAWPAERIETVWSSTNPIPGRLLEETTRSIAAKEMFDQRRRIPFDISAALGLLSVTHSALRRALPLVKADPITARNANPGWAQLPTMSIAFSLAARAAAYGVDGAASLHELSKPYLESLARMSPRLVEQDLILAELWMAHWSAE